MIANKQAHNRIPDSPLPEGFQPHNRGNFSLIPAGATRSGMATSTLPELLVFRGKAKRVAPLEPGGWGRKG